MARTRRYHGLQDKAKGEMVSRLRYTRNDRRDGLNDIADALVDMEIPFYHYDTAVSHDDGMAMADELGIYIN